MQYLREVRIYVLYIALAMIFSLVTYAELKSKYDEIKNQSAIIGRVVKDALDQADLGDWEGGPSFLRTPFDRGVFSEYVPTIGVILNIYISFPISQHETNEDTIVETVPEPTDLWEKHIRPPSTSLPMLEGLFGVEAEEKRVEVRNNKVIIESNPSFGGGGGFGSGLAGGFAGVASQEFDEERVERLQLAILDTVAKYGHRLTALPDGERLVLIVHAKTSGGPVRISSSGVLDDAIEKRLAIKLVSPGQRESERILFSVPKAAIVTETTRDALVPGILEQRY